MIGEPLRASAERGASRRVAVLLILASFVSVGFLAKHSLGLRHSSPSHWITQVCKMREERRTSAPRPVALRAPITILRNARPGPSLAVVRSGDPSPTPGFFRRTTLRAPPVA